jgi:hypothetical protein
MLLLAPKPKGWSARRDGPRGASLAGTAVLWEGEPWEVVEACSEEDGVRYRLVPWDRTEVFRGVEPYPPPEGRHGAILRPLGRGEVVTPEEAARRRDLFHVRVPFLALLPAADQVRLEELYGFDPISQGRRSAVFLLVFSAVQVVVSLRQMDAGADPFFPWTAIGLALYLAGEQVWRLGLFARREPAGSVLGPLVRPFSRVLIPPR